MIRLSHPFLFPEPGDRQAFLSAGGYLTHELAGVCAKGDCDLQDQAQSKPGCVGLQRSDISQEGTREMFIEEDPAFFHGLPRSGVMFEDSSVEHLAVSGLRKAFGGSLKGRTVPASKLKLHPRADEAAKRFQETPLRYPLPCCHRTHPGKQAIKKGIFWYATSDGYF
jgi:hypothetical protein